MQAFIPRQAVLVPLARKECRHSFPGRQCNSPSQEGVQADIPRQAVLVPPSQEEVGKSGASRHSNSSSVCIY